MPLVDVLDDTFVRVPVTRFRGETADRWAQWLPDLELVVTADRGPKGVRWSAGTRTGDLSGTAEVWLEAVPGGTVVHLYVRLDPPSGPAGGRRRRRRARDLPDRVRLTWKRALHRCKDDLEGSRP